MMMIKVIIEAVKRFFDNVFEIFNVYERRRVACCTDQYQHFWKHSYRLIGFNIIACFSRFVEVEHDR